MSLKQNVEYIKEEIHNDEKMLEGLLRLESWFRRYKSALFVLIGILIIASVGYISNHYYQANQQQKLANAYENARKGDLDALEILKDSKSRLYDLYRFQNALNANDSATLKELESSKDPIIAHFASIQNASLNANLDILNSQKAGDFGYLQAALLEIKMGNLQQAREILGKINNDSPIREIADALAHFSIKGIKDAN